eukprot:3099059-Pleurochrysis_carterae.AAC.1
MRARLDSGTSMAGAIPSAAASPRGRTRTQRPCGQAGHPPTQPVWQNNCSIWFASLCMTMLHVAQASSPSGAESVTPSRTLIPLSLIPTNADIQREQAEDRAARAAVEAAIARMEKRGNAQSLSSGAPLPLHVARNAALFAFRRSILDRRAVHSTRA